MTRWPNCSIRQFSNSSISQLFNYFIAILLIVALYHLPAQVGCKIVIFPQVYALSDTTYYIHQDHLGSVVAVSDGSGISYNKYAPYGKEVASSQYQVAGATERKYTGQIADKNTSLAYYNARYYDPVLSRFISADSTNDQLNRYSYVGGNPVMRNDPGGNMFDAGGGGGGGGRKRRSIPTADDPFATPDDPKFQEEIQLYQNEQNYLASDASWQGKLAVNWEIFSSILTGNHSFINVAFDYSNAYNTVLDPNTSLQDKGLAMAKYNLSFGLHTAGVAGSLTSLVGIGQEAIAGYGSKVGVGNYGTVYARGNTATKILKNPDPVLLGRETAVLKEYGGGILPGYLDDVPNGYQMQKIEGVPLPQYKGKLSGDAIDEAIEGLRSLHQRGFRHGDLFDLTGFGPSENILVTAGGRIRITDPYVNEVLANSVRARQRELDIFSSIIGSYRN